MENNSNRSTISDVAQLAGVSPATVSKVINDAPYVSAQTRLRVKNAVTKLNFRPNSIARGLKAKHTLTLGLVTDDLEGVFTTSMMRGVEEVASAQGFSVFLCNSYGEAARERKHLQTLLDKQVDGVILLSGYRIRERGGPAFGLGSLPLVYLYQYTRDEKVAGIIPDDFQGAELGTNYLLQLGHRRIGFINGPVHYEATHLRLEGYKQALVKAGVNFDPALVKVGKWYESSGYQLTHELMALSQPPDAIFCSSDSIAVGSLDALHELKIRVPKDVSLLGFDNRPFSPHQRPPLTTVALPLYEMGKLAGQIIMDTILKGINNTTLHRVPCYLVERNSCAPVQPELEVN